MKLAEERVGPHVVGAAKESCKKALALEARLTEERLKRLVHTLFPQSYFEVMGYEKAWEIIYMSTCNIYFVQEAM